MTVPASNGPPSPSPPAPAPTRPPLQVPLQAPLPALAGIVVHWRDEARLAALTAAWPRNDPRFELVVVDNSGSVPAQTPEPEPAPEGESVAASSVPADRAGEPASPAGGPATPAGISANPIGGPPTPAGMSASSIGDPANPAAAARVRLLRPGRNLGFAGGVNAGVAASRAPLLLLLNPDVVPELGALERLIEGFAAHPEAAGLAPRLAGADQEPQFAWQLRRLPSAWNILRQTLPWPTAGGSTGLAAEPLPGTVVEQPAAAALALRRQALAAAGGLDERFYPAWFEDVDLARRLRQLGGVVLYWPAARFRHALGSTVPRLGYGPFLWIYYRNLERYLAKHHGAAWALAARATLAAGLAVRLPLVPLRRPRRAASRREAAAGLLLAIAGALSGWRLPRRLAHDQLGGAPSAPVSAGRQDAPDEPAQGSDRAG